MCLLIVEINIHLKLESTGCSLCFNVFLFHRQQVYGAVMLINVVSD